MPAPAITASATTQIDDASAPPGELSRLDRHQSIPLTADSVYRLSRDVFAQTTDEYIKRVGIAILILRIDMRAESAAANGLAGLVHQLRQPPKLIPGQLHALPCVTEMRRTRIQNQLTATEFGTGLASNPPQQSA